MKQDDFPYIINKEEMVDIHCHLLYGVDDGARNPDVSLAMLDTAREQGIREMIVTPHYRRGMFPYLVDAIVNSYEHLAAEASLRGIDLYLGCEYHADDDMTHNLQTGRVATLAGTDYVLTEFSYASTYFYVHNKINELVSNGYIPVIAHAERYGVFQKEPDLLSGLREMGALIQLNADSILGIDGSAIKRTCKRILKGGLADIVASDSHDTDDRRNNMLECRRYVEKKYGRDSARDLFRKTPGRIIEAGLNYK